MARKELRPLFCPDVTIQGAGYERLPTSRCRVWCLERLRAYVNGLAEDPRHQARALLERHGCWEPLWRVAEPRSGHDADRRAPVARGIHRV